MAVVVTVAKGCDLGYIWKTQAQSGAGHITGGYYISAALAGEPPGRWWGPGAQALGLAPGQSVERKPYGAVYRQVDPRTGGPDVRALPDGRLWLLRDAYAAETAWAPRHTGWELRLARLGAFGAAAEAQAARKAGDHDRAARHEHLPASYRALRDHYQQQETARIRDLEEQPQAFRAGEASPALRPPWRDAILQPPQPQITPSAEILQLAAEPDIEPEAGG